VKTKKERAYLTLQLPIRRHYLRIQHLFIPKAGIASELTSIIRRANRLGRSVFSILSILSVPAWLARAAHLTLHPRLALWHTIFKRFGAAAERLAEATLLVTLLFIATTWPAL
jgi:hypothetical protein